MRTASISVCAIAQPAAMSCGQVRDAARHRACRSPRHATDHDVVVPAFVVRTLGSTIASALFVQAGEPGRALV